MLTIFFFSALFHSEEKESARVNASCNPSWHNAIFSLDGLEVRTRRS